MNPTDGWNSLEITKLVFSALTPIVVAVLGWWISRRLKRLEHAQWANQKFMEKRLEVYSNLAPVLNDLYCYFDFIGDWKMKDPIAILNHKRCADRMFYVNATLFSPRFRRAYKKFMDTCFIPGPRHEYDTTATLKADVNIRRDMFAKRKQTWNAEWDTYYSPRGEIPEQKVIGEVYWKMMHVFVRELGVGLNDH
jgi:hypothetical protein